MYKHKPATNHQQFVYLSKYHRSDYSVWSECYATKVACIFFIAPPILRIQRNNLLLFLGMSITMKNVRLSFELRNEHGLLHMIISFGTLL